MPHDAHFLGRLDRVESAETDLALGLYRDHELVRFILSHAKIPAEAERVAIALDHGVDGPWIVVARSGAFVTCLGRGMTTKDLPIITRAQLAAWGEKHEEVRRRVALANERGATEARFVKHVMKVGRWLSREDFEALTGTVAPIAWNLLHVFLQTFGIVAKAIPNLALQSAPRSESERALFSTLGEGVWAMGHLALAINEGADREWMRKISERQEMDGFESPWRVLGEFLALPVVARAIWCGAKMGKLVLPQMKAAYANPAPAGLSQFEAGYTLVAIATRHSGLRAEALKALAASSPPGTVEAIAGIHRWFHDIAAALPEKEDTIVSGALQFGRAHFHAYRDDFVEGSKYRFDDVADVPEDLARTSALNAWMNAYADGALPHVAAITILAGRSNAGDFYFPADVQRDLVVRRTLAEGIELAKMHRGRSPRPPTARAEAKPGRNDPCSCGSGKKYKKCCGGAA